MVLAVLLALQEVSEPPRDWELLWTARIGGTTFRSTIFHVENALFVACRDVRTQGWEADADGLWDIEARSGYVARTFQCGDDLAGAAWHEGVFVMGCARGDVHAVRERAEEIWRTPLPEMGCPASESPEFRPHDPKEDSGRIRCAGAVGWLHGSTRPPSVVVGNSLGLIAALDFESGAAQWTFRTGAQELYGSHGIIATPALFDVNSDGCEDVIVGARDRLLRALSGTDGSLLWQRDLGSGIHASCVILPRSAYGCPAVCAASSYGTVVFLNARTGEPLSEQTLRHPDIGIEALFGSPAILSQSWRREEAPHRHVVFVGTAWGMENAGVWGVDHDAHGARAAWRYNTAATVSSGIILADVEGARDAQAAYRSAEPELVFTTEGGALVVLTWTGRLLREIPLPGPAECTPLVEDIDGDGYLDVVAITRDGTAMAWRTPSRGRVWWGQFRGDLRNSGQAPE